MKINQNGGNSRQISENRLIARQLRAITINSPDADFLVKQVAQDIGYRISAINRKFANVADLYSLSDEVSRTLTKLENIQVIYRYELPGVAEVLSDVSRFATGGVSQSSIQNISGINETGGLDLVVSAFGLHSAIDLQQTLTRILLMMEKDGLLMIALPARGTLMELQDSIARAELELSNGAAMRVDPFMDLQQAGQLLQSVGFKLPVVDKETVIARYDNMFALVSDLRAMGMTSLAPTQDRKWPHRKLFKRANEIYKELYSDEDGRIRASFCIAYLTGWSPHENQQKPLDPGSGRHSLAKALQIKK